MQSLDHLARRPPRPWSTPTSAAIRGPAFAAAHNRRRQVGAAIVATCALLLLVVVVVLVLLPLSHRLGAAGGSLRGQRASGDGATDCAAPRRAPAVCSHRGNASELGLPQAGAGFLDGLEALFDAGVRCFDLDVVRTRDGHLLVGHPSALLEKQGGGGGGGSRGAPIKSIEAATLSELRAAGVGEGSAPPIGDVFRALARLRGSGAAGSGRAALRWRDGSLAGAPLLALELKGDSTARSARAFAHAAEAAAAAGVADSVVLWVIVGGKGSGGKGSLRREVVEAAQLVREAHRLSAAARVVTFGLGFVDGARFGGMEAPSSPPPTVAELLGGDSGDDDGGAVVSAKDLAAFDVFGPSVRLPRAALASLASSKAVLAWTVDDEDAAAEAVRLGFDALISNRPIWLASHVREHRAGICSGGGAGRGR